MLFCMKLLFVLYFLIYFRDSAPIQGFIPQMPAMAEQSWDWQGLNPGLTIRVAGTQPHGPVPATTPAYGLAGSWNQKPSLALTQTPQPRVLRLNQTHSLQPVFGTTWWNTEPLYFSLILLPGEILRWIWHKNIYLCQTHTIFKKFIKISIMKKTKWI